MKEIILCKYGEIILKGANRSFFEDVLCRELRYRASHFGKFEVYRSQSTVVIEPMSDDCDIEGMYESASKTFGIIALSRAAVAEKNMDAILSTAKSYLPRFLEGKKSFKAEAKRSDKSFPLNSPAICEEVGAAVLEACPDVRVDVHNPDVIVKVEVREFAAYIHAGQYPGAGGMPVGTNGKGLLLLSGGIDSPVAGHMMAKRGLRVEALHFESFPYTSERAREKVFALAGLMGDYLGTIDIHVVSLTHIQEELKRLCDEDYFTLLLRRFMMRIAEKVALSRECGSLVTGESLGQVASQTMQALAVTNAVVETIPVFRPCIGLDKEEIIKIARKIGTYETSILPYEDCCTVFTPRHPKTRPEREKVEAQEALIENYAELVDEAFASLYTTKIHADK